MINSRILFEKTSRKDSRSFSFFSVAFRPGWLDEEHEGVFKGWHLHVCCPTCVVKNRKNRVASQLFSHDSPELIRYDKKSVWCIMPPYLFFYVKKKNPSSRKVASPFFKMSDKNKSSRFSFVFTLHGKNKKKSWLLVYLRVFILLL